MPAFLIKYHRQSGHVELRQYETLLDATLERLALDKTNQDPDLEIVAVASNSLENLKTSHARYFAAIEQYS